MCESSDNRSEDSRVKSMAPSRKKAQVLAWVVSITYAQSSGASVVVSADARDSAIRRLPGRNVILGIGSNSVSATATIEATSHQQAALTMETACDEALARAEIRGLHVVDCHVVDEERLSRDNAIIPDLVGVSEIAQMMGVSKQRAWQYTKKTSFPNVVQETKAGRFWNAHDVEAALQSRSARQ